MLFSKTKLVGHSPTDLMVRGRVEDCGDGSVFDELRPAADQKIPLAEFGLAIFRPQVDQATGARE